MNIFGLSLVFVTVLADDYDTPRGKSTRGCVFPNIPQNLNARTQSRGRILRFMCEPGFVLIGKRFSTCFRGRWNSPPPICIGKGCPLQSPPQNGRMTESYDGAMVTFGCNPGYVRNGSGTIYCALPQWNSTAPTCTVPTISPNVSCDFEGPDLCGWSHDVSHDFEWKRNKFSTPSGHVGTGPSFDHTLGKGLNGNYMYLEASAPQKQGDTTRLFSPVYPTVLSGSCFTFWYHMYGSSIGSLGVYLKEEKQVLAELTPVWSKDHETGNQWLQGQIHVPQLSTNFQLVIEGVRGADYMGDIAVDDVSLHPGLCPVQSNHSEAIQGNGTTVTTTDEGGGAGVPASQDFTSPTTTTAHTRGVTSTILPPTTITLEPRTVGTTPPVTPNINSTIASTTFSITSAIVTSPSSTSKTAELTSPKTETTTASTQPQQTDYVTNTSTSTQGTHQTYSTSPRIDASKTTEVFSSTDFPTIDSRYITKSSPAITITPSTPRKVASTRPPTSSKDLNSTPLQSTTTLLPTTKKGFVFPKFRTQTQMTATSLPTVSTTLRSTTNPESNLDITTRRFPFIIKNPTTTTISTITTTTTTNTMIYTSSLSQSTASTIDDTTTSIRVPDSSNLTATTALPVTTTKATASPRTPTTSTRKPFIYIVPKTNRTVTEKPLGGTTQTRQTRSTYPLSPKTTQASTQYSTSTKQGTTKRKIPIFPPKQVTTPTSTTDIRRWFPESSEEISTEDEEDNSGQSDDSPVNTASESVSETKPEASARWEEFPRRPHPREKQTSGARVSALATACSLGAVFLVVSVFTIVYLVRRRKLKHQRYESTSEMRYITQSEELQLGSADNSDMIKLL